MTEDEFTRIQEITRQFKPSGITGENYETLLVKTNTMPAEPATARQINYLRGLRYTGTMDLTKQEACNLIATILKEGQ